jgi:serine/threonine protein kinase
MSHPAASAKAWEPPSVEELSAQLHHYEIEALLGCGGMGAVYKGRQTSLDRPVAIKILPLEIGGHDTTYAQRFKNEAKAMAKLNHPGIVAVHDFGETSSGLLYFVMEFVEGTDVARMIAEQGRLHSEHAMAITAHVCDALGYAHSLGILHRDIKPANIMVGYDGRVKVADFGLAKLINGGESAMTRSGVIMGTLPYMAPESLILGTDVDRRVDIYSVGVMLYQMLTGRLPQGLFEMPSQQIKGLDPRYDMIVATALRDDRELRYSSAEDLRLELDNILTQPVLKVEALSKDAPAALDTEARPRRPEDPRQSDNSLSARERAYQPERRSRSGWGFVPTALVIAAGVGVFVKLKNHEWADENAAAISSTLWTPPKPPRVNTKNDKAVVPPSATKSENSAPKVQPSATTAGTVANPSSAGKPAPASIRPVPATSSGYQPASSSASPTLQAILAKKDEQFRQQRHERVTKPFEQSLNLLNEQYLRAIDREITKKSPWSLDIIRALKAEKKTVSDKIAAKNFGSQSVSYVSTVPEIDDQTPEILKILRDKYREAFAGWLAIRATNLKLLINEFQKDLEKMEMELAKTNQVTDANAVHSYRETLAQPTASISLPTTKLSGQSSRTPLE